MRVLTLLIIAHFCNTFSLAVAQTRVAGQIATSDGKSVPYANVVVKGSALGVAANADGLYELALPGAGEYTLAASAIGFSTEEHTITVESQHSQKLDFTLQETVLESDGIVITGTMVETHVKDSPVKVDVISARYLQKTPTANLTEVIENVNGLYNQIDCGVCYTNNIRINGMDGPYTAVLIDGMPIVSSLSTVYGLNGISPTMIRQIEIVKGPVSTLYGTEALSGVINIITKDPEVTPRLALNTFATSDRELNTELAVVPSRGRFATLLSGSVFHTDHFVDRNRDGFTDFTLDTRATLFAKGALKNNDGYKVLNLSAKYYYEDRVGGTEPYVDAFSRQIRGSDSVYGESIFTNRFEALGTYHILPRQGLQLDAAYNWHDQNSFYGDEGYAAKQEVYFSQLRWHTILNPRHELLIGGTARYQHYDDNTAATGAYNEAGELTDNRPDNRFIPGLFTQHEYIASDRFRGLYGLRLDHQGDHGFILSPRASLKFNPRRETTLRWNAGTGFRVVNLFTEDHLAYTGGRATIILEDLRPERSVSTTFSLQQNWALGGNPLTLDLDGFYTYFTNKIEPDYSIDGEIRYANLAGSATTRGVSIGLSQNFIALPLSYTAGATLMDVYKKEDGRRDDLEFAPAFQGTLNLTYRLDRWDLALDYTANFTGPMTLPDYAPETAAAYERATGHPLRATSPTFSIHNLQLRKEMHLNTGSEIELYAGLRNVFDYRQPSPLVGYYDGNPGFGDSFDTAYVYGPIRGRSVAFGMRYVLAR